MGEEGVRLASQFEAQRAPGRAQGGLINNRELPLTSILRYEI